MSDDFESMESLYANEDDRGVTIDGGGPNGYTQENLDNVKWYLVQGDRVLEKRTDIVDLIELREDVEEAVGSCRITDKPPDRNIPSLP